MQLRKVVEVRAYSLANLAYCMLCYHRLYLVQPALTSG